MVFLAVKIRNFIGAFRSVYCHSFKNSRLFLVQNRWSKRQLLSTPVLFGTTFTSMIILNLLMNITEKQFLQRQTEFVESLTELSESAFLACSDTADLRCRLALFTGVHLASNSGGLYPSSNGAKNSPKTFKLTLLIIELLLIHRSRRLDFLMTTALNQQVEMKSIPFFLPKVVSKMANLNSTSLLKYIDELSTNNLWCSLGNNTGSAPILNLYK